MTALPWYPIGEILHKYHTLDECGKEIVNMVLDKEYGDINITDDTRCIRKVVNKF